MDFFLEPFWYIEYENIHFQYYSKLEYFKNDITEFTEEEERKRESYELNVLHAILNKIRFQYNSYFCSDYRDFENLFDFSIKHKCITSSLFKNKIPILMNDDEEKENYEINLIRL